MYIGIESVTRINISKPPWPNSVVRVRLTSLLSSRVKLVDPCLNKTDTTLSSIRNGVECTTCIDMCIVLINEPVDDSYHGGGG